MVEGRHQDIGAWESGEQSSYRFCRVAAFQLDIDASAWRQRGDHFLEQGNRPAATGVQCAQRGKGLPGHGSDAVGGAIERVVVQHDETPFDNVHVELHRVHAQGKCAPKARQRVFRKQARGAPVADDDRRVDEAHVCIPGRQTNTIPIMSYQVLARKLRPATFDALVGQEHVVRALRHALDHDRLHHAYLFTGTRGVGKTTIARVLAKSLNCEVGVGSNPCGECSVCREVAENRFIDLIEVDAASRTRVDDTRELLENAQYLPTRGRYKVYLIDEVHMLSGASFNALLKTLEEPPSHVVFLLATTDPKKVPVTVLSRCLQFQLKNLTAERIAAYLGEVLATEGVPAEAAALETIGAAARGSMRDALSITDQAIAFGQGAIRAADLMEMLGLVGRDAIGSLLDALAAEDAARLLALAAELAERSADFDDVLEELIAALHRIAVAQALREPHPHADAFAPELVQLYYQIALLGHRDLAIAPDARAGFEMTLLRMLAFAPVPEDEPPRDSASGRTSANPRRAAPTTAPVGGGQGGGGPRLAAVSTLAQGSAVRALAEEPRPSGAPPAQVVARSPAVAPVAALRAVRDPELARDPVPDPELVRDAVPDPAPELAPDADHWHELLEGLDVSGMARLLAEHSECLAHDDAHYRLRLDERHDALLADGPVAGLERALAARLGRAIRVRIELGPVTGETPALRKARLRQEQERAARAMLEENAGVQALLSTFAARLEEVRLLKD